MVNQAIKKILVEGAFTLWSRTYELRYIVKDNHAGSAVSEILKYRQKKRHPALL